MSKEKPSPAHTEMPVKPPAKPRKTGEFGGFEDKNLPEPTRFGDWEVGGRCSDF